MHTLFLFFLFPLRNADIYQVGLQIHILILHVPGSSVFFNCTIFVYATGSLFINIVRYWGFGVLPSLFYLLLQTRIQQIKLQLFRCSNDNDDSLVYNESE